MGPESTSEHCVDSAGSCINCAIAGAHLTLEGMSTRFKAPRREEGLLVLTLLRRLDWEEGFSVLTLLTLAQGS